MLYPGDKSKLCFTDTDSFLYKLETQNVHKDMLHHHELFDFSNFHPSNECFSQMNPEDIQHIMSKNKKVLGKFKDELGGEKLEEFVGLRAKMYSFRSGDTEVKKLKGILESVVKNDLTFNHYKECLYNQTETVSKMKLFQSKNHVINTIVTSKVSLSSYDDKRYILDDRISSYAHGHYRIE